MWQLTLPHATEIALLYTQDTGRVVIHQIVGEMVELLSTRLLVRW